MRDEHGEAGAMDTADIEEIDDLSRRIARIEKQIRCYHKFDRIQDRNLCAHCGLDKKLDTFLAMENPYGEPAT